MIFQFKYKMLLLYFKLNILNQRKRHYKQYIFITDKRAQGFLCPKGLNSGDDKLRKLFPTSSRLTKILPSQETVSILKEVEVGLRDGPVSTGDEAVLHWPTPVTFKVLIAQREWQLISCSTHLSNFFALPICFK